MSQGLGMLLARAMVWDGSAWVKAPGDAAFGQDVDVTRSVLPTGAATEATVAGVKTGTDKIPASPAQEHATAASPHSVRLTDGAAYLGTTAQRLHVSDGGVALGVSGPLTDAQLRASAVPVDTELPAAAALSDTTANPTAPMVGVGTMLWDSAGAQWVRAKPAAINAGNLNTTGVLAVVPHNSDAGSSLTPQKRASELTDADIGAWMPGAGGMMWNGTNWSRLRGDTTNGLDVDVTRMAALVAGAAEIGKVQISDGTDVATVLPTRTQPATTEKALTAIALPTRMPNYQFTTAEIAAAITLGIKELCTLFSPAAVTQDVYILEIVVSTIVTTASTAGRSTVRVCKTAAVGTGGTNIAVADLGGAGADPVSGNAAANVMQAKTGGAADGTVFIRREWEHALQPVGTVGPEPIFVATNLADAICLRGGVADGINVSLERAVAHTALVDQTTVSVRYLAL